MVAKGKASRWLGPPRCAKPNRGVLCHFGFHPPFCRTSSHGVSNISENRQLTEVLKVRVSRDDLVTLRAKSDSAGLPLSAFMRAAGLARKITAVPDDVRHGLVNLGRLGGVLRLALAQIDQGRLTPALIDEIQRTLERIRSLAESVRELLR